MKKTFCMNAVVIMAPLLILHHFLAAIAVVAAKPLDQPSSIFSRPQKVTEAQVNVGRQKEAQELKFSPFDSVSESSSTVMRSATRKQNSDLQGLRDLLALMSIKIKEMEITEFPDPESSVFGYYSTFVIYKLDCDNFGIDDLERSYAIDQEKGRTTSGTTASGMKVKCNFDFDLANDLMTFVAGNVSCILFLQPIFLTPPNKLSHSQFMCDNFYARLM